MGRVYPLYTIQCVYYTPYSDSEELKVLAIANFVSLFIIRMKVPLEPVGTLPGELVTSERADGAGNSLSPCRSLYRMFEREREVAAFINYDRGDKMIIQEP